MDLNNIYAIIIMVTSLILAIHHLITLREAWPSVYIANKYIWFLIAIGAEWTAVIVGILTLFFGYEPTKRLRELVVEGFAFIVSIFVVILGLILIGTLPHFVKDFVESVKNIVVLIGDIVRDAVREIPKSIGQKIKEVIDWILEYLRGKLPATRPTPATQPGPATKPGPAAAPAPAAAAASVIIPAAILVLVFYTVIFIDIIDIILVLY